MFRSLLKPINKFRKSYLPGIVTGGADDDPSAISTYSIAGVATGFSQLWLLLVSTPLLIAVQWMSAKIGDITKKGLIVLIKENFGKKSAYLCVLALVAANLITLIADVVGMAAGFQLLTGENYIYFIVPLMIALWAIIVFNSYKHIARFFYWFAGILVAYVISAILAKPDWGMVFKSFFAPQINFSLEYALAGLALMGTTFSPYAFFWQTEQEIEERNNTRSLKKTFRAIFLGFVYSNLIAFFIIVACASAPITDGFANLTIKDIAQALTPLAGSWAPKLFGIGLIGAGILAIPILASSSAYAIAQLFSWPQGLDRKPKRAKGFYAVITAGFLVCLAALIFNLNPIKIIFYSQVLVGILTILLIYFILRIAGSKKIMGSWRCGFWSRLAGWLAIAILLAGCVLFIYFLFK